MDLKFVIDRIMLFYYTLSSKLEEVTVIRIIVSVLAVLGCVSIRSALSQDRGSLYGWVVVLDPGHGGEDPGSSHFYNRQRVTEDEYVYDVMLRVRRIALARGAIVFSTVRDNVGERNWHPSRVFPDLRNERFSLDNSIVRAGTAGLRKRLLYGNSINRRYPSHRRAWISIHFDVLGRNNQIDGVRIIAADTSLRLVETLERSFGGVRRLRDDNPIVGSGDREYGIRRLFVLGPENNIREKVLIELGNFNNQADLWRVRNPVVRESYAFSIVRALEDY